MRIYKKNQGLFEVGGSFAPKVLRVGPFVADDLRQDYSLEEIARWKTKFGKQMDEVKRELFRKATIIFTTLSSAG